MSKDTPFRTEYILSSRTFLFKYTNSNVGLQTAFLKTESQSNTSKYSRCGLLQQTWLHVLLSRDVVLFFIPGSMSSISDSEKQTTVKDNAV